MFLKFLKNLNVLIFLCNLNTVKKIFTIELIMVAYSKFCFIYAIKCAQKVEYGTMTSLIVKISLLYQETFLEMEET